MQANIDNVKQINAAIARYVETVPSPRAAIVNNIDYDALPPTFKKLRGCGCCYFHTYGINDDSSHHNTYVDFVNFCGNADGKCSCNCVDNANLIRFTVEKYYPELLQELKTA
jgi:hypothetical protein